MSQGTPEYLTVYTVDGKLAGEMIRLMLEAQGIPAIMLQESVGETYGLTMTPLGQVDIRVPADRFDEAVQILQEMEAGRLETNEDLTDLDIDESEE